MAILMTSCSQKMQSPISDYQAIFKPIKTSPLDTCDTIIQVDNQTCTFYANYGTDEQREDCAKYRIYQEVYKDNRRVGCNVEITDKVK